jgi:exosortase/archaeosortase family protein
MKKYYHKLKLYIKRHKLQPIVDVVIFGIIIYFFHWLWWSGGLKHFLKEFALFSETEEFLAHIVAVQSSWILDHLINYPIELLNNTIYTDKKNYVAVLGSCSGLKQFYQWTVLMVLFPGPWKKKLWYIPFGILIIHLFNLMRIITLVIVADHWPKQWDFIHMTILRPIFYLIIFLLWVLWVEKIRVSTKDKINKEKVA